jgi:23S rRNA pseudouridine1911/1915/1917 synthase
MADRTWTVADEAGVRLDKFLAAPGRLGSRTKATRAIDRGKVFVNGIEAATADAARLLDAGDEVRLWMDRPGSGRTVHARVRRTGDLVVVYEDAQLLVVDKPQGLLAVPLARRSQDPSLMALVERHLRSQGKRQPHVVHRIDRDSSGLVVFAKDRPTLANLKAQFLQREPERVYLAIVHGHPSPESGTWRDHLVWDQEVLVQRVARARDPRAKEAISEYRVVRRLRHAALLEVRLVTGKRNQIRLQAGLRGHGLVGEQMYVSLPESARIPFPRQALHAWRLVFRHPATGRTLRLEAPLPEDMSRLLESLS